MKVAVTGASGIQGMSAMIYLLEQSDVEKILATDHYNLARLEKRIEGLGDDRLCMSELDCTNEDASAAAFKGYDVVVNCAHIPGYYLNTTRSALRAGANYIDLGSSGQDREIFELSDEFRKRNRTAITSMGTAPGLSNVMAVYCMNKIDKVDSIDYMWGVVDIVPPEEHTRPLY